MPESAIAPLDLAFGRFQDIKEADAQADVRNDSIGVLGVDRQAQRRSRSGRLRCASGALERSAGDEEGVLDDGEDEHGWMLALGLRSLLHPILSTTSALRS